MEESHGARDQETLGTVLGVLALFACQQETDGIAIVGYGRDTDDGGDVDDDDESILEIGKVFTY